METYAVGDESDVLRRRRVLLPRAALAAVRVIGGGYGPAEGAADVAGAGVSARRGAEDRRADQTCLQTFLAKLLQRLDDEDGQADRPPAGRRLRLFELCAAGLGSGQRSTDSQAAGVKIDVVPGQSEQ